MTKPMLILITFPILLSFFIDGRSFSKPTDIRSLKFYQARRWGKFCSFDYDCGRGICQMNICQCNPGYMTWRFMEVCEYEQRKKLTAFLLSFFVGVFGIDWFVLSRSNSGYIIAGIIKLIITLICVISWPITIRRFSKKDSSVLSISNIISVLLSLTTFIWWLTDWIRVLAGVFKDGNGAPLQPWTYQTERW